MLGGAVIHRPAGGVATARCSDCQTLNLPCALCPSSAGFVGELEGELTVEPGERVKVHSEVDGWARVIRLSDNRTGLVPSWAVGGD